MSFRDTISRRWVIWGALAVGGLLLIRAVLPVGIQSYVNRTFDKMDAYDGEVGDVDLHLWRGAYRVENLRIDKTEGGVSEPFLTTETLDISLEWSALMRGAIVADVTLLSPELTLVNAEKEKADELGEQGNWIETLKELSPFQINRFEVIDGKVAWLSGTEAVPIELNDLDLLVKNVNNAFEDEDRLPASLALRGRVHDHAQVELDGAFDILADPIEMDLSLATEPIYLEKLNPILKQYANLDAQGGTLEIFSEFAVDEGAIDGYLKVLADELDIFEIEEDSDNPIEFVWEGLAGVVTTLTQNQPRDQFATRVPINGRLEDVKTGVFPAIGSVFKNAFIKALDADFEGTVNLNTVSSKD